jgi:hypothetical protein
MVKQVSKFFVNNNHCSTQDFKWSSPLALIPTALAVLLWLRSYNLWSLFLRYPTLSPFFLFVALTGPQNLKCSRRSWFKVIVLFLVTCSRIGVVFEICLYLVMHIFFQALHTNYVYCKPLEIVMLLHVSFLTRLYGFLHGLQ